MSIVKKPTAKIVFISSIFVSAFWIVANSINVYSISFVGAFFELLWLPAILLTIALPIISLVLLFKEKQIFRSFYFYSILLLLLAAFIIKFIIS